MVLIESYTVGLNTFYGEKIDEVGRYPVPGLSAVSHNLFRFKIFYIIFSKF